MTQSSLQTQCPKCETRFRVTDEQLSVARGKVRCGNCMNVFNAIEHQAMPESPYSGRSTSTEPAPAASPGESAEDEELVFEDNPEEDATEGRYAGGSLTFSEEELSDSFRNFDHTDQSAHHDDEHSEKQEDHDESWAEAMLKDHDHAPAPTKPETPENPTGPEKPPEPESSPEPEKTEPAAPAAESLTLTAAEDDRIAEPAVNPRPQKNQKDNLYEDLRHEPVAIDGGGSGWRKVLWSLVILTLLGVLVAQAAWFQFDRLAAIPELRPFYEKACDYAGCELKPLIDVDAIQSRKLVVRTNPDNRSQLIVDAVIINQAGFEQPFPAIALTFSNLNGDVVAQSSFTPQEYLAGDASDLDTMPRDTPVRIAINIRDPGRDAVNYNLSFRPWSR